jgi:hypothetical protein
MMQGWSPPEAGGLADVFLFHASIVKDWILYDGR